MASPDPPQPPEPPSGPSPDAAPPWFEPNERIRWLTYTGTVLHHRGVPYVLFDHHLAPPGAAYAITKLQRISPVQSLSGTDETSPPPVPPSGV